VDDKKLLALAKKNAAKSQLPKNKPRPVYDATLDATRPAEIPEEKASEADAIFREMKRREF
jgi:5-methylcytosine-specific restriction endonuclease McrBC GTP-binding regulatory subunit McrB